MVDLGQAAAEKTEARWLGGSREIEATEGSEVPSCRGAGNFVPGPLSLSLSISTARSTSKWHRLECICPCSESAVPRSLQPRSPF